MAPMIDTRYVTRSERVTEVTRTELCRRALHLRYRLMPHIYAAFMRASQTGHAVQQPLVFQFQDDRGVCDIDDQYLLGNDLLVAPVCTAGQRRARRCPWYSMALSPLSYG